MAETTTDFEAFLDAAGPEDEIEREALYYAVTAEDDRGLYSGSRAANGKLLIKAEHADLTLLLASEAAEKAFIKRLRQDLSEEGASFEGDAAFRHAMNKDD